MKTILFISLLFVITSCSNPPVKAPVIKSSTKAAVKKALPESLPNVVKDVSAPQPETNTASMPDITGESVRDVNCAMGQDNRTVSIIKRTDDIGWGVVYSKFGSKNTIAIARHERSFCDEIVERVKGKLQSAGFQCDGESSSGNSSGSAITGSSTTTEEVVEEKKSKLQEKMEEVKDAVKKGADSAGDVGGKVMDKAKDAGSAVVDKAKDAGNAAMDKAKEAASAVKGQ